METLIWGSTLEQVASVSRTAIRMLFARIPFNAAFFPAKRPLMIRNAAIAFQTKRQT